MEPIRVWEEAKPEVEDERFRAWVRGGEELVGFGLGLEGSPLGLRGREKDLRRRNERGKKREGGEGGVSFEINLKLTLGNRRDSPHSTDTPTSTVTSPLSSHR